MTTQRFYKRRLWRHRSFIWVLVLLRRPSECTSCVTAVSSLPTKHILCSDAALLHRLRRNSPLTRARHDQLKRISSSDCHLRCSEPSWIFFKGNGQTVQKSFMFSELRRPKCAPFNVPKIFPTGTRQAGRQLPRQVWACQAPFVHLSLSYMSPSWLIAYKITANLFTQQAWFTFSAERRDIINVSGQVFVTNRHPTGYLAVSVLCLILSHVYESFMCMSMFTSVPGVLTLIYIIVVIIVFCFSFTPVHFIDQSHLMAQLVSTIAGWQSFVHGVSPLLFSHYHPQKDRKKDREKERGNMVKAS